jgi:hypothetical protein
MAAEPKDSRSYVKRFSGTLVAALVLVSLVGYLYFFQIKKPDEEEKLRVFPAIDERRIGEIELKYSLYTLVCRKDKEKWFIFEDSKKFRADDKIMSTMAESISQMKVEKVISEDAKDLSGFGLDRPGAEVNAKTPEKEYHILIGGESPTGSGTYIRVDNNSRIILVNESSVEEFLRKSANDLRDKRVVSLEEDKINKLYFKLNDSSFEIEKKDGKWVGVDNNKGIKVDDSKVQELLGGIEGLKVEKFVNDNPNDLAPYGLDKPDIEVTISEANKKITLLFGKRENGRVYAKFADEKPVYLVSDEILSKIPSKDRLIKR